MIKLMFCLRRRADLTREEFQTYWRETHAPLVAERAAVLGCLRYTQCHTADLPGLHKAFQGRNGGAPEPFDGVAELWFGSFDTISSNSDTQMDVARELLADERNFIDLANSPMFITQEHTVVDHAVVDNTVD